MKIALVNYRYFISGGPERYFFNIKEILERNGHTVIPFSVKGPKNFPTEYERYFIESVGDEEYFAKTKKTVGTVLKSFSRMFYSTEARRNFTRLLADTKPDLVYIMQYHNKISPSIIYAARSLGIPVVHRISDFQYMCPNALFYNDRTGVCEDCLKGRRLSCIRNKCVHGSTVYSAIKAAAKGLHDLMDVPGKIDAFVVPSTFTLGKLAEYGIAKEKLHHIPTFFNSKGSLPEPTYEPYFLYVGRIEKQKGLQTLIDAFAGTPYRLKIIGFSNDGYIDTLRQSLDGKDHNIEFLGRMDFDAIVPYLSSCLCTLVPSEWYDNFPNAILESFAFSKPVIATDFGSLPELVKDGTTGLTFPYGDVDALRRCVSRLAENPAEARRMGANARQVLDREYSPEAHYSALMELLEPLAAKGKK
ncbi:MAG: glycosyltransferase family 4 protein [Muribaculaceae bacterium]|nr:glycosyltransferase family 4 protein [Muribaculaceae bacterium]